MTATILTQTELIQELEQLKEKLDNLSTRNLSRDASSEALIASHHISRAIKLESYKLKRQNAVKTLSVVDTATIEKTDIHDWLAHGNGLIEFILMNGQNFFLRGEAAIAFCKQMELIK